MTKSQETPGGHAPDDDRAAQHIRGRVTQGQFGGRNKAMPERAVAALKRNAAAALGESSTRVMPALR